MLECLKPLIGLSNRDCNCPTWTTLQPTDYNTSLTGLYIDDNLNLSSQIYSDCGDGTIWDVLETARRKAILRFEEELLREISKVSGQKKGSFIGEIAEASANGIDTNSKDIVGLKISSKGVKGTVLKIRSLKIGVNASISTNVRVLKNGIVVHSVTANLTANVFTPVATNYVCDMSETCDIYHIVYDLPTNVYALNNALGCNCPGKVYPWKSTVYVSAVMAQNNIDFIGSSYQSLNSASGIVIDAYVGCDPIYFICDFDKLEGYNYKLTIAKTIQLLSEIEVVNHILRQNAINFYTLLSRESLYGIRAHSEKVYAEQYLAWLAQEFSKRQDCFECETTKYITKSALMI